ncbi:2-hydroxyacyl-CoA lyase 1 [Quaeritorhiza haematococci]|nr:2-hydroxyacyl-CoA lyase 1 [Quaeritorhiza haematococci]
MEGAAVIAKALKTQGVKYVFGVVGIPVVEIAEACIAEGLVFIGMRNAGAIGYLTGKPGVCLVVSGPGLVHALAGLSNAWANCWPMIVIGGSSETAQENMGAFQEIPQVEACRLYTKFTTRPGSIRQIPFVVEKAVRMSTYGRPGACYIDIPAEYVTTKVNESTIVFPPRCPDPPKSLADPSAVEKAAQAIANAKNPLVIVGKGAGYACAEAEIKSLIEETNLPFLPTPMGKGVLPDTHSSCVAAARSLALKSADVVILLGARLNWILHFGQSPRFRPDVKVIQVDIAPEEMGNNIPGDRTTALLGHLRPVVSQLTQSLKSRSYKLNRSSSPWWKSLAVKVDTNKKVNDELMRDEELPMSYYRAFKEIKKYLDAKPEKFFLVSEGANTMDIGRTIFDQHFPRTRLDAGTFGTMGLGSGFAIAAQLVNPDKRVVCIQGDSAFGFGAMEIETAARRNLPLLFIIINNNGIYAGLDEDSWKSLSSSEDELPQQPPSTSLLPNAHYEIMATAFGGVGIFVQTPQELDKAVKEALTAHKDRLVIINVMISPYGVRKQQEFSWLTRSDEAKL